MNGPFGSMSAWNEGLLMQACLAPSRPVTLATEIGAAIAYAAVAAALFHLGLARYRRGATPAALG